DSTFGAPNAPWPSRLAYHWTRGPDGAPAEADTTSRSPSPSKSPAATDHGSSAEVVTAVSAEKLPAPSRFSYQATSPVETSLAKSTSRSPSPSTSAGQTVLHRP